MHQVQDPDSLQCRRGVIWPACLPSRGEDYSTLAQGRMGLITGYRGSYGYMGQHYTWGHMVTWGYMLLHVTGWGKLGQEETWSRLLRKAEVSIATSGECEDNVRDGDGGRAGEVMLSLFQLFHTGFGAHNLFSLSPGK